jgi:hypothetical protein
MKKSFKYGFTTCTLAYFLVAVSLFILETLWWRGLSAEPLIWVPSLMGFITGGLSQFSWWGDFYYLAPLVPWLASSCVLALLINRFNGGANRRALLSGFSVFIYYFAMWLAYRGDAFLPLIFLWPLFGFGIGYAAATIVERILKRQVVD